MDNSTYTGTPDGIPFPVETPDLPKDDPQQTLLEAYRSRNMDNKSVQSASDAELARTLYDAGEHKQDETFPAFATRVGVQLNPIATAADTGLRTATFHIPDAIESGISGLGTLFSDHDFMKGYRTKQQELDDLSSIGKYQNPGSNFAGNVAGTVADYVRFGPLLRAAGEYIPGLGALARSGPLGDSMVKLGVQTAADEASKSIEHQIARNDGAGIGDRVGDVAKDTAIGGAEGAGSAVLGSALGKGLRVVAGPTIDYIGKSLVNADNYLAGLPRSLYTAAAGKLTQGYTGSSASPLRAALDMDTARYGDLLDNSGLNVGKGIDQLTKLIETDPGAASLILRTARANAPESVHPILDHAMDRLEAGDGKSASALFRNAVEAQGNETSAVMNRLNEGQGNPTVGDGPASPVPLDNSDGAIGKFIAVGDGPASPVPLDNSDGAIGKFIGSIYKELIPARLAGPLDPAAAFDRNLISGRLSDQGKLIDPPLTGMGSLGKTIWERSGGGPGKVAGAIGGSAGGAPVESLGGLFAKYANIPSMLGMKPLGYATQAVGNAVKFLGEPGAPFERAGRAVNDFLGGPVNVPSTKGMPGAYQTGIDALMPSPVQHNFDDVYAPPPAEKRSEIEPGDLRQIVQSTPPDQVIAYVGQRLGPQVAQQLQDAGPEGYGAAINALLLDPQHRSALMG